ncbi:MAG: pitrilysin family protein [Anaerolineales bacterium]
MPKETSLLSQLDLAALPGPETIRREVLPNGAVVLIRENFSSPSVVLSGYLPAGALANTADTAGLAFMTAIAMTRGTQTRSFQQIFESLESIGARLSLHGGTHTTAFQGKALIEDLGLLLELLADVLQNPSFPKAEFERLRAQQLTALAIREQDTGARAQMAFDTLVYRDHPYGLSTGGYVETISELAPSDLRRFHRDYFGPSGLVITIVGGVKAERVLDLVASTLGQWKAKQQQEMPDLPKLKPLKKSRRIEVRLEGKAQSELVIGTAGPSRYDEDYLAAAMGNSILGRFGLMGRIGEAVRVSAGLAYYAYSAISGGPGPGPWQVVAGVNPKDENRAIEIVQKEIKRFTARRVSEEELFENKANFIGRLPMQLESNEGVAGAISHIERYGLGLDYYQRYQNLIAGITREQVLAVGKRYLDPERLAVVISGPDGGGV